MSCNECLKCYLRGIRNYPHFREEQPQTFVLTLAKIGDSHADEVLESMLHVAQKQAEEQNEIRVLLTVAITMSHLGDDRAEWIFDQAYLVARNAPEVKTQVHQFGQVVEH